MYYVYNDNHLIFDPQNEDLTIIDPKLDLSLNSASYFMFSIPANHPYYDSLVCMKSRITVYQGADLIFEGRIISFKNSIYNTKEVECEGGLAFFNDSIWKQNSIIADKQIDDCLSAIILNHNKQVPEYQFEVGIVTVTNNDGIDLSDALSEYVTTRDVIKTLIELFGGYVKIRYVGDKRIIDYLAELNNENSQTIEFGSNLIDFSRNLNMIDIATAVIPLGAVISKTGDNSERLTISSVNNNVDYVYNQEAVNEFGWIFKVVIFDNAITAQQLKDKGIKWLSDTQWDNMTIELKAFDLHYEDATIEQFGLGDRIHVISPSHGLDRWFLLSKMTVYLTKPQDNFIVLGESTAKTLSDENQNINLEIEKTNKKQEKLTSKIEQTAESITSEVTRATEAEGNLSTKIEQTAESITLTLNKSIQDEVDRATAAESDLSTKIEVTASGIKSEVNETISSSVAEEKERAEGKENDLLNKYNGLTEQMTEFSTSISQNSRNITLEATARSEADDALSGRISVNSESITSEVTRATEAENDLSGKIELTATNLTTTFTATVKDETDRATEAEGNLAQRTTANAKAIGSEISRAMGAEKELSSTITQTAESLSTSFTATISAEAERATKAEETLSSSITQNAESITAEVTRATEAEGSLSSSIKLNSDNISAEVTRATTAEGNLSGRISINADNITAEITRATTAESNLSTKIQQTVNNITLSVSSTALNNQTTSTLTLKNGNVTIDTASVVGTTATQAAAIATDAVNGITLSVSNSTTAASSTLTLKNGNVTITSGTIELKGMVTFTDLESKGKTKINGDNITTGTISADRIDVDSLYLSKLYTKVGGYYSVVIDTYTNVGNNAAIIIGGNGTTTYGNVYATGILASQCVYIGNSKYNGSYGNNLIFDINNRLVYPNSTGSYSWGLGASNKPFETINVKIAQLGNNYSTGKVGFFGTNPAYRQSVSHLQTNANLSGCISKINSLLTALKTYGLITG